MLFVEPTFLFIFLPAVLLAYSVSPRFARNILLLFASLVFYAWGEKEFVLCMVASIGVNYGLGLVAEKAVKQQRGIGRVVAMGVFLNLLPLAYFKYAAFFAEQLTFLSSPLLGMDLSTRLEGIHLPIGISFFTFQGLSYVLDVAAGRTGAQRNIVNLGLYIALFPQLIAGPIVRYTQIQDQLAKRVFRFTLLAEGARRFVLGAAKKLLLANPLAEVADSIFELPGENLTCGIAWLGALAYTFQIYFDFSGYSDMAVGLGRMFGFRIPRNFNYPYVSRSISEFWRRWHISLSSWFRDYLFIPLGGSWNGRLTTFRNLLLVFLLCGLWHGADWGFVLWGAYHGAFLIAERAGVGRLLVRLPSLLRWIYAMAVTIFGWVLFRASTGPIPGGEAVGYFFDYAGAMLGVGESQTSMYSVAEFVNGAHLLAFVVAALASTPILLSLTRWTARAGRSDAGNLVTACQAFVYALLTVAVIIRASSDAYSPFIYFQF